MRGVVRHDLVHSRYAGVRSSRRPSNSSSRSADDATSAGAATGRTDCVRLTGAICRAIRALAGQADS